MLVKRQISRFLWEDVSDYRRVSLFFTDVFGDLGICRKCLDGGRIVEAIPEFANGSAPSRNKSPSGSTSPTSTN